MSKFRVGLGLIACAVVLACAGALMWVRESQRVEDARLAEEYRSAAVGGRREVDPNRVAATAVEAIAVVMLLSGVVLVAVD